MTHIPPSTWLVALVIILGGAALVLMALWLRIRSRNRMLLAVLQSFDKPLLFYNEAGRLVFHSSGLVLFDPKSLAEISRPPAQPTRTQQAIGEIIIDFNRYRFTAKLLEYMPGTFGTLILLDYKGSISANKS